MMRDLPTVRVPARAVDVGYFNVKYTTGRSMNANNIGVGMFSSLSPRLSHNSTMHSPGTVAADGCIIAINGVRYFVGNDAVFNSSGLEPRPVLADYSTSDKYLALLRGALHYISKAEGSSHHLIIEHLVLGLPLNTYLAYKDQLLKRATGTHTISLPGHSGGQQVVTVEDATVLVQPQGALVNYGIQSREQVDGWTLVMDPGGGTLDWFLSKGRTPNWERSSAYPKSMLACSIAVCDRINPDWKNQFEIVERIDETIRNRAESFRVGPTTYALKDYWQTVESVLDESIRYMLGIVGATDNLDRILLTGGGATVFNEHLKKYYPKLAAIVHMDEDPVFSNVRGFQVVGEMMVRRPA